MEGGKKEEKSKKRSLPYMTESAIDKGWGKLVLKMRIRNRWMRGTMSGI
jgi:hypothetical protein